MNSYDLSREWFDFCFDNPEKISPNHTAIYFFAIEHCNRLGWKKKYGFPSQMTMDALGIKKHQTYIRYFNDLVDWGFFKLIQKSKNQYSANIISLISAKPKSGKALDKAIIKHAAKQTESNGQSNSSIVKPVNHKQRNKELVDFPNFVDEDTWTGFLEMRKTNKKPLTERAIKSIIKKIEGFESILPGSAIVSLERSIVNCWADVYMPKAEDMPKKPKAKSNSSQALRAIALAGEDRGDE